MHARSIFDNNKILLVPNNMLLNPLTKYINAFSVASLGKTLLIF